MASCYDGRSALTMGSKRSAEALTEDRLHKRAKDYGVPGATNVLGLQAQPAQVAATMRNKRALEGPDTTASHIAVADGKGDGRHAAGGVSCGEMQRVLQSSDLENSISSITAALRWRSPVKPHKLARLHGPDHTTCRPTAVRGIVDIGADEEEAEPGSGGGAAAQDCNRQQRQPAVPQHQPQAERKEEGQGEHGAGAASGSGRQHPEWGQLFTALSLGGGRGSQRTDPVWAALGNNRAAGSAAARRSTLTGPDSQKAADGPAQAPGGVAAPAAPGSTRSGDTSSTVASSESASAHAGQRNCAGHDVGVATPANVTGMDADGHDAVQGLHKLSNPGTAQPAATAVPAVRSQGQQAVMGMCTEGPAVTAAMDASPVRGLAMAVDVGEGLERPVERPRGRSGSSGGFLAQEAGRLLAASMRC